MKKINYNEIVVGNVLLVYFSHLSKVMKPSISYNGLFIQ